MCCFIGKLAMKKCLTDSHYSIANDNEKTGELGDPPEIGFIYLVLIT